MKIIVTIYMLVMLGISALAAAPAVDQIAAPVQPKVITVQAYNSQGPILEITKLGLFVIGNAQVVRYDKATLKELGKVALLPPLPAIPPVMAVDRMAYQKYDANRTLRDGSKPAQILSTDKELLILYAGQYYRIDAEKMEIKAQVVVIPPPVGAMGLMNMLSKKPPTMIANDKTVLILTETEIISLDRETGKELSRSKLPVGIAVVPPVLGPPAKPNPGGGYNPPVPAKTTVTKVGAVINHADVEGGIWTVKDDAGDEYILTGTKLEKLLGEDGIEGKKIRVTGTLTPPGGAHNFGKGSIEFTDFQIIPD